MLLLALGLAPLSLHAPSAAAQPSATEREADVPKAEITVVTGRVVDGKGQPLQFASVQVEGTLSGGATDADGSYLFRTSMTGRQVLVANTLGYTPRRHPVDLSARDTVRVDFTLRSRIVELGEVVVTPSAFTVDDSQTGTLSSFDIYTTAGSSGDIYRATSTFPGVTSINKGAGLYVRGGDLSETITLIDNAPVADPYKFESPTTSLFGSLPTFLIEGLNFSTGGFSAKYGNALSGVLDMTSLGMPTNSQVYANLSLAGTSIGVDHPINDAWGVRSSGNHSFTNLLFWVNGTNNEFSLTPRSTEGNLNVIYQYSPTGTFKLFNFVSTDRIGVRTREASFSGIFEGNSTTQLHNLYWTDLIGSWSLEANAAWSRFDQATQFGALDLSDDQTTYLGRIDATYRISRDARLNIGAEVQRTSLSISGGVPPSDNNPDGTSISLSEQYQGTRAGGYAEIEVRPLRRVVGRVGLRSDYHSLAQEGVVDPRLSIRYLLDPDTHVQLSWGVYHQFPAPDAFNGTTGNPNLIAQRAQHWIAGIERETSPILFRVEGYYKPYDDLVIQGSDAAGSTSNEGYGTAWGVDGFLKYGAFLETTVYGRIAYGYVQSNRLQLRAQGQDETLELGPTPFDITHNLTVVANTTYPSKLIGGYLSAGVTARYATGAPHTPIIDAVPSMQDSSFFLPVEGPIGALRLPDYLRFDSQVNFYLPLVGESSLVLYVSTSNILGRENVVDYEYSADFSERRDQKTDFDRSYYFGANVTYVF
ncbi:MAG: TonB-dependent receptor plug domain-containing protein [Bacteroidetes bacterium]|jgi:outer membrane cobalamin receptor|nr:TonB-dependent receptor plug domain-containing protein [Bacteroidota bacterium]